MMNTEKPVQVEKPAPVETPANEAPQPVPCEEKLPALDKPESPESGKGKSLID